MAEITIKIFDKAFPQGKWSEYLKSFTVQTRTMRTTKKHPLWNKLKGKGFEIWISFPVLQWRDELYFWEIIIESNNLPEEGIQLQEEFLKGFTSLFEDFKIIDESEGQKLSLVE